MNIHEVKHPLIDVKLTALRDKKTPSLNFRKLTDEIVMLLGYEATKNTKVRPVKVETPLAVADGYKISEPKPIVIPILRAGLGMLQGFLSLFPNIEVGFLGMKRDEETLQPFTYAKRLPPSLEGRECYIIDPMIGTGNSTLAAIDFLHENGAKRIVSINILASPEGVKRIEEKVSPDIDFDLYVAKIDEGLNEHAYILPGLGDAGDRLYGVVD